MNYEEAIKKNKNTWQSIFDKKIRLIDKEISTDYILKLAEWIEQEEYGTMECFKRIFLTELFMDYHDKQEIKKNLPIIEDLEEDKIWNSLMIEALELVDRAKDIRKLLYAKTMI